MSNLTNIQVVTAYGRLLEFSSNKRYGLVENSFTDSLIDSIALNFNTEIKKDSGLDILVLEEIETIKKYEEEVDKRLSEFTYKNIIFKKASEKEKAFMHTHNLAIESFLQLKIEISDFIKETIKGYPLTIPDIYSLLRHPIQVNILDFGDTEEGKYIYITTEKTIKGKKRLILFVMSRIRRDDLIPTYFWSMSIIGVFSKPEFFTLVDSPITLFFKYLDLYGHDIQVGDKAGKYVFSEEIPHNFSNRSNLLFFPNGEPKHSTTFITSKVKTLSASVRNAFSLNIEGNLYDSLRSIV